MRSKGFKYTDDEVKAFCDNVYAIMGKNSFGTQEDFAARIGVSDGTLRKYLNGRIETIQYATVREICKVGHMSEKELFGETRSSEELEIVEKELNRKIIEYDTKIDLDKIGKEMRSKKKMEISNKINFFQIEN